MQTPAQKRNWRLRVMLGAIGCLKKELPILAKSLDPEEDWEEIHLKVAITHLEAAVQEHRLVNEKKKGD